MSSTPVCLRTSICSAYMSRAIISSAAWQTFGRVGPGLQSGRTRTRHHRIADVFIERSWRKTICVISVRHSLSSAASSCASSFSEMLVKPAHVAEHHCDFVLRGFHQIGISKKAANHFQGSDIAGNAPRRSPFFFLPRRARDTARRNPRWRPAFLEGNDEVQPPSMQEREPYAKAERHEQQQTEQHRSEVARAPATTESGSTPTRKSANKSKAT